MPPKSLSSWLVISLLLNGVLGGWVWFLSNPSSEEPLVPTLARANWNPQQSLQELQSPEQPVVGRRHALSYQGWVSLLSREAAAMAANAPQNLSVLAGDSISLWFPVELLPPQQVWLNQGISGETTEGLLKRVDALDTLDPQRIFIMIGINDLLRERSPQQVLREQTQLVQRLKRHHPHTAIVVQSILPHSGDSATWEGRDRLLEISNSLIQDLNNDLAAMADREGVYYLDLWPLFVDEQNQLRPHLTTDGLHLNADGYLVWSAALQLFERWQLDPHSSGHFATQGTSPKSLRFPIAPNNPSQARLVAPDS